MLDAFTASIGPALLFLQQLRAVRVMRWDAAAAAPVSVSQVSNPAKCASTCALLSAAGQTLLFLQHLRVMRWDAGSAAPVCVRQVSSPAHVLTKSTASIF